MKRASYKNNELLSEGVDDTRMDRMGYRRTAGFTMTEVLVAVAIVVILCGLVFVAIWQIQIQMRQLSLDGTAKEIHVAATNHLALAESQGLLNSSNNSKVELGNPIDSPAKDDTLYYVVHKRQEKWDSNNVLELMLPFGAIDETVRIGGSYIIHYQPSTGLIQDVFYADDCNFQFTDATDFKNFLSSYGDGKKDARKEYVDTEGKSHIIGYYHGSSGESAIALNSPTIKIENGDTLKVTVTNPASNLSNSNVDEMQIRVIVTGKESGAGMWFDSRSNAKAAPSEFVVTLDDVRSNTGNVQGETGERFYKLAIDKMAEGKQSQLGPDDKGFIPGENLYVQAWVTGANKSGRPVIVAKTAKTTVNSLFATGNSSEDGSYKASINSFRHLANLSGEVSMFNYDVAPAGSSIQVKQYSKVDAIQTTDLKWKEFSKGLSVIYFSDADSTDTGTFLPVKMSYSATVFTYDGANHSVSDFKVSDNSKLTGQADDGSRVPAPMGLFDSLSTIGSKIENLELVNCSVTSSDGDAGALVGTISAGTSVTNVLVRDDLSRGYVVSAESTGGGNAGGLIGSMNGGTVSGCAASVYVQANTGAAGGLIGSVEGDAKIENSYSGGHTNGGKYDSDNMNVLSASGDAGGLIGTLGSGNVTSCYSTCSAAGGVAGGLVGSNSGSVGDSYATGLVSGSTASGAFAGSAGTLLRNRYLSVINGDMPAVPGQELTSDKVAAADSDTTSYIDFSGSGNAIPYDMTRVDAYGGQYPEGVSLAVAYNAVYPFKTISELMNANDTERASLAKHLKIHYGDWPVLETLVINAA